MERVTEFIDFLEEYTDFIMRLASNRAQLETRQGDMKNIDDRLKRYNNSEDYRFVVRELRFDKDKLKLEIKRLTENNERLEKNKQSQVSNGLCSLSGISELLANAGLDEAQVEQALAGVMFRINSKLATEAEKAQMSAQGPSNE